MGTSLFFLFCLRKWQFSRDLIQNMGLYLHSPCINLFGKAPRPFGWRGEQRIFWGGLPRGYPTGSIFYILSQSGVTGKSVNRRKDDGNLSDIFKDPANDFKNPANDFKDPANDFGDPANDFGDPAIKPHTFCIATGRFRRPGERFRRPGERFQKPGERFQKPGERFRRPGERFQRPGERFRRPGKRPFFLFWACFRWKLKILKTWWVLKMSLKMVSSVIWVGQISAECHFKSEDESH